MPTVIGLGVWLIIMVAVRFAGSMYFKRKKRKENYANIKHKKKSN